MSQVSKYPLDKDIYDEIFDVFLQTIANLNTKDEVLSFFNEFLTPTEKIMFTKRLAAGLLIAEGYDYREISDLLKTSTSTIATYSSFYKYGDGYKRVIDRIKLDRQIKGFLVKLGTRIADLGSFGGKGSGTWRSIARSLRNQK